MTGRQLLDWLQSLPQDSLEQDVSIYDGDNCEFYPASMATITGTGLSDSIDESADGVLDDGSIVVAFGTEIEEKKEADTPDKLAIHCPDFAAWDAVLKKLSKQGMSWYSGKGRETYKLTPANYNEWETYGEKACLMPSSRDKTVTYASSDWCLQEKYDMITASDWLAK